MKKPALLRTLFMSGLVIAGMNFMSSCDSCSRPDGSSQGTEDGSRSNSDTRGTETPEDNEGSGGTSGTSGEPSRNGKTTGANRSASGSGTKGAAPAPTEADEQTVTDQIENSSTTPRDKNGRPVNSGGTSGSGMGTGTGSTGNNSKVTRPEDQN